VTASSIQGWRTWAAYPGVSDVLHSPWRSSTLRGTEFATWQKSSKRARCQGGELRRTRAFGAETRHRDHGGRGVPDPDCTCGIGVLTGYDALLDRVETFGLMNKPKKIPGGPEPMVATIITGRVDGSGTILSRGRKGAEGLDCSELRVQNAQIVELWIPPEAELLLSPFTKRYGVPVSIGFPERVDDLDASPDVRALMADRGNELAQGRRYRPPVDANQSR